METKIELTLSNKQTQLHLPKTSVFDVDDLSFFRFYGLGLRHVELAQGKREAEKGSKHGDAVSLACYGVEQKYWENFSFDAKLCTSFQEKVEAFILSSYQIFHEASSHYTDAAFLLMLRGGDARMPYDFSSYPLGKCGTKEFTADKVMSLMTTEHYANEDINHAVYNTLIHLKDLCRQLKLQKTKELLNVASPELHDFINELMDIYQKDIFLDRPFFLIINTLNDMLGDFPSIPLYEFPEVINLLVQGQIKQEVLEGWIQNIDNNHKKGVDLIKVLYTPENSDKQIVLNTQDSFVLDAPEKKGPVSVTLVNTTLFNQKTIKQNDSEVSNQYTII